MNQAVIGTAMILALIAILFIVFMYGARPKR